VPRPEALLETSPRSSAVTRVREASSPALSRSGRFDLVN
jgi:hypothetical protein